MRPEPTQAHSPSLFHILLLYREKFAFFRNCHLAGEHNIEAVAPVTYMCVCVCEREREREDNKDRVRLGYVNLL